MKKLFALVICIILIGVMASAEESFMEGNYEYVIQPDGTAMIRYARVEESSLVFADTIQDIAISGLYTGAIYDPYDSVIEANIPLGMVNMEGNPFYDCNNMTTINVAEGHEVLFTLDGVLFDNTGRLVCYPRALSAAQYVIPEGTIEIGAYVFMFNDVLTEIIIPEGVEIIGDSSFSNCDLLVSIEIPSTVTEIHDYAFLGCENLTSITLPEGLTFIGEMALYADTLESISIPASVVEIAYSAFDDATHLIVESGSYAEQYAIENGYSYETR